jgi:hypothetical protein
VDPIICAKDAGIVLQSISNYLESGNKIIKDIQLMEQNESQIVFVVDDKPISKEAARIWWSGYSAGMKAVLT